MKIPSLLKEPRSVRRTGDNTAAGSLLGYVWRMSEWHQVAACLVAVVVALLNLAPLELQRRIVNEVVETQNTDLLIRFCAIYVAVILLHQAVKFGLRLYQGWMTDSAIIYTRSHLLRLYADRQGEEDESGGRAVSIVGSEVDKLGGFVGEALSQAVVNLAMLLGVTGYMLVVEPGIAVFALGFLVPQVVLTPLLQRKLNALVEERLSLLRDLGDEVSEMTAAREDPCLKVLRQIFTNRMRFNLLKFALKTMLNLLRAMGPVTVLIFGGYMVMQGETQVGVLVAFLSGFERLAGPLRELIAFYRVAAQANVQHEMIAEWMQTRT
ncbi:ABC transporter ATP-binding protein [uncultured Roseobacter sp.]|uniref:ABC transporter ATP-binding protein n=1 Tax=uncultured Roseobacter sp. TaxID=114847 RepID=UPI002637F96D|nr:ABC transporter ATP-binding protein [uncultured Roseobacter sp.]